MLLPLVLWLSCWDEVKSVSSAPYWNNSEFIELGHERRQLLSSHWLPLPLNWSTLILLLHSGVREPQLHSEDVVTCGLWRASVAPLYLALLPLGRVHWCPRMGELGTDKARPSLNHPRDTSEAETKKIVPLIDGSSQTQCSVGVSGYLEQCNRKADHLEP